MIYLVVGTILLAVIIIVLLINNVRDKVRLITLVICLVTLTLSVVSSYEILFQPFDPGQLRPLSLLNPQLIFFFNVLVKFLIFYWLVAIATGIINRSGSPEWRQAGVEVCTSPHSKSRIMPIKPTGKWTDCGTEPEYL